MSDRPVRPATPLAAATSQQEDGPFLMTLAVETWPLPVRQPDEDRPVPLLQKVTAIGFVRARMLPARKVGDERLEVLECRAGGRGDMSEADLLRGFWASFEQWHPRLVTFNGRGFALPVLRYASMRHFLAAPAINAEGRGTYTDRYGDRHIDLMDVLSDHRASPWPGLTELADVLGIPRRADGEPNPRDRAVANAATMFAIYLRWRVLMGGMTPDNHDMAMESLLRAVDVDAYPGLEPFAAALEPATPAQQPQP